MTHLLPSSMRLPSSLMDASESLCAIDQLPDGTVWGTTPHGRLARFSNGEGASSVLDTTTEVSVDILPLRLLSPRRPLEFEVRYIKVCPSEKMVLVAGYANSRPHLVVVFLSTGSPKAIQSEAYNHICCEGDFIFNRPGMMIRQMSWWPGDDPQFFVVLSGNFLAIYDAHSVSVPYATYRLLFPSANPNSGVMTNCGNPVAFTFLEDKINWMNFAVVILREDGALFVLCPITVPGVPINKATLLHMLHEPVDEAIQQWHRFVISRSQLAQSDDSSAILTRGLPSNWKHPPALQGPLDGGNRLSGRGFESIQSLREGIVAFVSITGQLLIAELQSIKPVFDRQDIRRGPPHVFVLQDCHTVPATGELEYLSEISMAPTICSSLQLVNFKVPSMLVCITENCLTWVDWSDPRTPVFVSYKNAQPQLGCIRKGRMIVAVYETCPMQLRCEHFKDQSHGDFQSLLECRDVVVGEDDVDMMKEDACALEGISDLRDASRMLYSRLTHICDSHEQGIQVLTPKLEGLIQRMKTVLANAASDSGKGMLNDDYKYLIERLSEAFKEMDVSAMETTEMMRWLEDHLKHLEVRDQSHVT